MDALFTAFLNAGISGSVMIAAVLALRLVLKRAPRSITCLLWLLVAVRLLCPFSIPAPFSLQPELDYTPAPSQDTQIIQQGDITEDVNTPPIALDPGEFPMPQVDLEGVQTPSLVPDIVKPTLSLASIAPFAWLLGVGCMLLYAAVSYLRLRWRVRGAIPGQGFHQVYGLNTAFVLGFLKPRIYLPVELSRDCRDHVLAHERAHIARGDHWLKLISFAALALHWYNPMVWLSFWLLCRDIEAACDQRVIAGKDADFRRSYCAALLKCSTRTSVHACPIAFAEISVKDRIRSVLNYRKSAFWLTAVAVIALVCVAVFLMTDPISNPDDPSVDGWGLTLRIEDATSTGGRLVFVQQGSIEGTGNLMTGEPFWIEAYRDGQWALLDPITEETVWLTLAYKIKPNGSTPFHTNWADIYGTLPNGHYRIGKNVSGPDGSFGKYYAEFTITDGKTAPEQNHPHDAAGWGLSFWADNVTPSGCSLHFRQQGGLTWQDNSGAVIEGELTTGAMFRIQVFDGTQWQDLTPIGEVQWDAVLYTLPLDGSLTLDIRWDYICGQLPPGTYRIVKEITGPGETRPDAPCDYYAEFTVTEADADNSALLEIFRRALEEYQSRGGWHLQQTNRYGDTDIPSSVDTWWISGENFLISTDSAQFGASCTMYRDGAYYQKPGSADMDKGQELDVWQQTDTLYGIMEPWVLLLQWKDENITLLSHQAAMGHREITLRWNGPLILLAGENEYMEVILGLDADGTLDSLAIRADLLTDGGDTVLYTSTMVDLGGTADFFRSYIGTQVIDDPVAKDPGEFPTPEVIPNT